MEPYFRNNYNMIRNNFSVEDFGKRINPDIMTISENYNSNNLNFSGNFLSSQKNKMKKNISEITKLNYNTEKKFLNNLNKTNTQITRLDHKLIESTSEDNEHPLRELLKGLKGAGWFSSRFSQFPQEIYIQFTQPVLLRQINMVIHEKNIPSQIKFYTYYPENNNDIIENYHNNHYKYIGFIKMDTNERSQFKARESRKIYVNTKSLFLKIQLGKNYTNQYNAFDQVGLMNLDFFGTYLPPIGNNLKTNEFILKHAAQKENIRSIVDQELEEVCGNEIKELKEKMNYNIKLENYKECKLIKMKLDKIRMFGKQIYDLENQKKLAVNNEDFDKALDIKNIIDKMKANLKLIMNSSIENNNISEYDNKVVGANKFSNIDLNINNNTNNNNSISNNLNTINSNNNNINENINTSNILNDMNNGQFINESINTNSIDNHLNTHYSNLQNQIAKSSEDNFILHDDKIVPAVLRRLKNEPEKELNPDSHPEKGELEPISPNKLEEYKYIFHVIGEFEMRKLFSKQVLWKDEGLENFKNNINDVLDYKVSEENKDKINNENKSKTEITNEIVSSIMRLSMEILDEKVPAFIIKSLKILYGLFDYIKVHGTKLDIDLNITDSVLTKIKRRLGDANRKVREEAVKLYCYMLTLDFCDYNNLISELLEEELKHSDSKYIPKSPNLIMGKLSIFSKVFDEFDDAINSKRTTKESFPSNLVMDYLILNVNNNKSEVRKLTRAIISKFIRIFGVNKIKKKLEKIEERELIKLINEIPSLEPYFPKLLIKNNSTSKLSVSNGSHSSKSRTKTKSKDKNIKKIGERRRVKKKTININTINASNNTNDDKNKNMNKKIKNKSNEFCDYCQRKMKNDEIIANHWNSDCPWFVKCDKCNMNIEVKLYSYHKLNECKFKNDFKECRSCKEVFYKDEYNIHLRNKCGHKNGYTKCPLCHGDIPDNNKGFFQHLIKDGCPAKKK